MIQPSWWLLTSDMITKNVTKLGQGPCVLVSGVHAKGPPSLETVYVHPSRWD